MKALSPVVASIILIAVTVAVSIAVGVWMFGLSGSFMGGAEQLKVTQVVFYDTAPDRIVEVRMANTGTSPVTVNEIWINNVLIDPAVALTIDGNTADAKNVTHTWSEGYSYEIKVITSKGTTVTYPASAPT